MMDNRGRDAFEVIFAFSFLLLFPMDDHLLKFRLLRLPVRFIGRSFRFIKEQAGLPVDNIHFFTMPSKALLAQKCGLFQNQILVLRHPDDRFL